MSNRNPFYNTSSNSSTVPKLTVKDLTVTGTANLPGGGGGSGNVSYNGGVQLGLGDNVVSFDDNTGLIIKSAGVQTGLDSDGNIYFGGRVLFDDDVNCANNVVFGIASGLQFNNSTSQDNVIIGNSSGTLLQAAANNNIIIGYSSGVNLNPSNCIILGTFSDVQANSINRIAIGFNAVNTFGDNSILLGNPLNRRLLVGGNNLYESVGAALSQSQAGFGSELNIDMVGIRNLFLGEQSGINVDTGNRNVGVGSLTLPLTTSQNDNTAIGDRSLENCESSGNTAIGAFSGAGVIGSGNNTCLGSNTTCIYSQATVIGHSAAASKANQCMIGSSSMIEVVCSESANCNLGTTINPWNQVHSKDKYYIDRFPVGRIYSNITPVTVTSNLIYQTLFTCPSNVVGNTTFCELGTVFRISDRGTILSIGPQTGPIQFAFKILAFGVELVMNCDLPDNDLNPAQGYFYTAEICFTGNNAVAIFQEVRIADEGQQGPFYGWKSEQVFAGIPANVSSNIQLQGLTQNSGTNVNTMTHIFGYVERL